MVDLVAVGDMAFSEPLAADRLIEEHHPGPPSSYQGFPEGPVRLTERPCGGAVAGSAGGPKYQAAANYGR